MREPIACLGAGRMGRGIAVVFAYAGHQVTLVDFKPRDAAGFETLSADDADHRRSWFVYVVAVPEGVDRDRVITELRAQGIGSADYVPCVHLQPYMREAYGFSEGLCPVAEAVAARTLALPFYPQLEAEDQERVVEALRAAL